MTGSLSADGLQEIRCQNAHAGRFAAIYFDHPGTLTVCEFQVFGGKFPLEIVLKCSSLKAVEIKSHNPL